MDYEYDSAGRLSDVYFDDGTYVGYEYDGFGRKVFRTEDYWAPEEGEKEYQLRSEETSYLYDGNNVMKEYTGNGSPLAEYHMGGGQVIARNMFGFKDRKDQGRYGNMRTRGGLLYYYYDALGNVSDLSDHLGENIVKYRWDAFGGMFAGALAPYSFKGITGKDYDPKSGLMFYNSRWYDPQVGRFTQADSFRGYQAQPGSQHPYAYVGNNPINNLDPTGHYYDPGGNYYYISDSQYEDLADEFGITISSSSPWKDSVDFALDDLYRSGVDIGDFLSGGGGGGDDDGDDDDDEDDEDDDDDDIHIPTPEERRQNYNLAAQPLPVLNRAQSTFKSILSDIRSIPLKPGLSQYNNTNIKTRDELKGYPTLASNSLAPPMPGGMGIPQVETPSLGGVLGRLGAVGAFLYILLADPTPAGDPDNPVESSDETSPWPKHSTVEGNSLPTTGEPNSSVDRTIDGEVVQRRFYDSFGRALRDVDFTDHGNPVTHPKVPHIHDWDWSNPSDPRNKAR